MQSVFPNLNSIASPSLLLLPIDRALISIVSEADYLRAAIGDASSPSTAADDPIGRKRRRRRRAIIMRPI